MCTLFLYGTSLSRTDWDGGSNLFPGEGQSSTFSNLHTLRENPDLYIHESEDMEKYFKKVFKNPVNVSVGLLQ